MHDDSVEWESPILHVGYIPIPGMISRDLLLGHACLRHVKVVLRHVSGRVDLCASVVGCKLVT